MVRYGRLLSDAQWEKIRPLLPKRPPRRCGGRPRADDRKVLEGLLWMLRSGAGLANFRRLVVRHDRSLTIYQAFFHIACFMIVLRRVLK